MSKARCAHWFARKLAHVTSSQKWLSQGAQPTEVVAKLLKIAESQPAPAAADASS